MSTPPTPSCLMPDGRGSRLAVQVVPRASKSEICGLQGDALKVRLQAPPVDGKANAALLDFLAKRIGLARSSVTLISGQASRRKVVEIAENVVDLEKRLFA